MQLGRLEALNSVNVVYREKFLGNLLKTRITEMERMSMAMEDSNLPTLHLNRVTKDAP